MDPSLESEVDAIISGFLTSDDDHEPTPRIVKLFSDALTLLKSRPQASGSATAAALVPPITSGAMLVGAFSGVSVCVALVGLVGLLASRAIMSSDDGELEKFEEAVKQRQTRILAGVEKGSPPKELLREMFDLQLVTWACDLLRELKSLHRKHF